MPTSSACKELAALFVLMDGLIMMLLRLAVFVMMLTAHVISMLVI